MFIEPNIETLLSISSKLNKDSKPLWGSMNAQRMIEHLTDLLKVSTKEIEQEILIPSEKIPQMHEILASDKPMPKNFEVPFAPKDAPIRNEELDLAIDEMVDKWLAFEELFEENPDLTINHAYYGPLNFEQWKRLHAKHFTHHFQQFGLM